MMSDLLAAAKAYAFEQWPPDHEVDDPFGATGVARSDEYGYDETARKAAIQMAEWVLAKLDRETLRDELSGWPIGSGYYQTTVTPDEARDMADAVLALLKGD